MPERGKFRKLFDSTELMCDAFLQSFLILVSSPLVSPPYPPRGGAGERLRATQVCVTGTKVNKIEVHNPLNPN
jgi:hypothetical protein